MDATKKILNQIKIPIRWVDLDAYAHVNNARYFDYMSEVRAVWLEKQIVDLNQCQFILINAQCTFKKPFTYPGIVVLDQYLDSIGNSSIQLYYEFGLEGNLGVKYAEGFATLVCFDPRQGKPIRITDSVRKLLGNE